MNDKPILYEDKIKNRDNEFLYNKCINQYHQLMNCQYKNKEYKNKINNLQSKIDKVIELLEDFKNNSKDVENEWAVEICELTIRKLKEDK